MVLDASALIAVLLAEPGGAWVKSQLAPAKEAPLRMSWINVAEVGMTCERAAAGGGRTALDAVRRLQVDILSPDHDVVACAIEARRRFPINFGDCFAYAHALLLGEALLTLDADFLKTDLPSVLHPAR